MSGQSTSNGSQDPRLHPARIDIREDAQLIDSDGGALDVVVTNISRDGFRLEVREALAAGEKVRLRVARYGEFECEIRWSNGDEAGGVFLTPTPSVL